MEGISKIGWEKVAIRLVGSEIMTRLILPHRVVEREWETLLNFDVKSFKLPVGRRSEHI